MRPDTTNNCLRIAAAYLIKASRLSKETKYDDQAKSLLDTVDCSERISRIKREYEFAADLSIPAS